MGFGFLAVGFLFCAACGLALEKTFVKQFSELELIVACVILISSWEFLIVTVVCPYLSRSTE